MHVCVCVCVCVVHCYHEFSSTGAKLLLDCVKEFTIKIPPEYQYICSKLVIL